MIGKMIQSLLITTILFIVISLCSIAYIFYDSITNEVIESKVIVKPKIKLTTDGSKIDTIYVYKFD